MPLYPADSDPAGGKLPPCDDTDRSERSPKVHQGCVKTVCLVSTGQVHVTSDNLSSTFLSPPVYCEAVTRVALTHVTALGCTGHCGHRCGHRYLRGRRPQKGGSRTVRRQKLVDPREEAAWEPGLEARKEPCLL